MAKSDWFGPIIRGELKKIKEVTDKGVPLNEEVHCGMTPLLYAIDQAKTSIAKLLIEKGADVNRPEIKTGTTPLMKAVAEGNLELVRVLITAGADVDRQDGNGLPALFHAVDEDCQPEIVAELINAGASVNAPLGGTWRNRATILMYAAQYVDPETIRKLIEGGADANVVKEWGTPLTCAIEDKNAARVAALLEGHSDPNLRLPPDHTKKDLAGKTALEYARELGLSKLVALLETGTSSKKAPKSTPKRAAKPADVKGIWKQIESILKAQAPGIEKSLNKGATKQAIQKLETMCGVSLPDDFKASYLIHDGQKSERFPVADRPGQYSLIQEGTFTDEFYDFMPITYIMDEWESWKKLVDEGEFSGDESTPDAGIQSVWWHPAWIPFATNGGGDSLCLDLAPAKKGTKGQVISMNHETAKRQLIAPSFTQFLIKLADHLADKASQ